VTNAQPGQSHVKGPLVWLDMDQRELDDAYDHTQYAPNRQHVLGRYLTNSAATRAILGEPERIAYGPNEVERLDLFRAASPNAPTCIFVHGGAWRGTTAADYSFLAEMFVRAGASLAILDFASVESFGGDLVPMVEQVRRGAAWVYEHARKLGADPAHLYLAGHSSGGHLGGCLVTTDWPARGLPADLFKGAVLASGMYDLRPVRLSKRSEYLALTDESEDTLSPIRHLDRLTTPLILSYGSCETPEFRRQTEDFARAVQEAGTPATLLVGEGYNHFEILETLANPYGLLGRAMLTQMGLAPSEALHPGLATA
jgi:arylformamidase